MKYIKKFKNKRLLNELQEEGDYFYKKYESYHFLISRRFNISQYLGLGSRSTLAPYKVQKEDIAWEIKVFLPEKVNLKLLSPYFKAANLEYDLHQFPEYSAALEFSLKVSLTGGRARTLQGIEEGLPYLKFQNLWRETGPTVIEQCEAILGILLYLKESGEWTKIIKR